MLGTYASCLWELTNALHDKDGSVNMEAQPIGRTMKHQSRKL